MTDLPNRIASASVEEERALLEALHANWPADFAWYYAIPNTKEPSHGE